MAFCFTSSHLLQIHICSDHQPNTRHKMAKVRMRRYSENTIYHLMQRLKDLKCQKGRLPCPPSLCFHLLERCSTGWVFPSHFSKPPIFISFVGWCFYMLLLIRHCINISKSYAIAQVCDISGESQKDNYATVKYSTNGTGLFKNVPKLP